MRGNRREMRVSATRARISRHIGPLPCSILKWRRQKRKAKNRNGAKKKERKRARGRRRLSRGAAPVLVTFLCLLFFPLEPSCLDWRFLDGRDDPKCFFSFFCFLYFCLLGFAMGRQHTTGRAAAGAIGKGKKGQRHAADAARGAGKKKRANRADRAERGGTTVFEKARWLWWGSGSGGKKKRRDARAGV